jgi:hypothetical protein
MDLWVDFQGQKKAMGLDSLKTGGGVGKVRR